MIDTIIIALILVVDSASLFLLWQDRRYKNKVKTARKFNKILKSVGLR